MPNEQTQLLGGNTHPGDKVETVHASQAIYPGKKVKGLKISTSGTVFQGGNVLSTLFVARAVAADWVASTTCSKHPKLSVRSVLP